MNFVVDAQLPPALARLLEALGHDAVHLADIGLVDADDARIWNYALQNSATIVTKDEDFAIRASVTLQAPAIVWLRIGNSRKKALLDWFKLNLPTIEQALAAGNQLIEVV